ncbi:MAG: HAD family hydrolase [Candidatus Krumholzibacteriia bacterium]
MAPNRLILFDIDGTLLVSRGCGLRAMHGAFQHVFGLDPRPAEILPHGKTDPILFEEMARAYGLPAERLRWRLEALEAVYATGLEILLRDPGAVEVKPGVRLLLGALARRRDALLGVVSGNLERTAWLKLEAGGLAHFFEAGAFGSDARERADLVALATRRFARRTNGGLAPRQVWVIGDTPDDVAGGHANGTRTLAVATGRHDRETLAGCRPDVVLDDLRDTVRVVDILCEPA